MCEMSSFDFEDPAVGESWLVQAHEDGTTEVVEVVRDKDSGGYYKAIHTVVASIHFSQFLKEVEN